MNPKSENVLKVTRNLEKVLPMATEDYQLDMNVAQVTAVGCGTTHCHGGWYAIAVCDLSNFVGFEHGATKMANTIGFQTIEELTNWAHNNPAVWGNDHGIAMFCRHNAFESKLRPDGAQSLQDIVDHWKEVYQRLVVLESKGIPPTPLAEIQPPVKVITKYVGVPESLVQETSKLILS